MGRRPLPQSREDTSTPPPSTMNGLSGGGGGDEVGNPNPEPAPSSVFDSSHFPKSADPPTSKNGLSGGGGGGGPDLLDATPQPRDEDEVVQWVTSRRNPSALNVPRCHPPAGCTSRDPYWVRGGLQPLTPDDISDDERDLSYLNILASGVDEGSLEFDLGSSLESPDPLPFTASAEGWAAAVARVEQDSEIVAWDACVAEAEKEMKAYDETEKLTQSETRSLRWIKYFQITNYQVQYTPSVHQLKAYFSFWDVHQIKAYLFLVRRSSHTRLCTTKSMLTVNGQFPGPTIYARRGELVVVDVINRADANITIHWHGVKMPRYPWTDGVDYVTQCPITPGKRFRQRILLSNEEGTLFWHAHIDWTRATVYGAIIILPPKTHTYPFPKPHAQLPILLGEWWNDDMQQVYKDFIDQGVGAKLSDAFLMNGQPGDLYPCSKQDAIKLSVEPGKTYLIRMVNAMMNFIMYFKIKDHNVTVVGMDGAYTKPLNTDHIAIAPGQTIDFLLEANQPPSRYYMAARVYAGPVWHNYIPTTGIVEYVGNYTRPSSLLLPSFPEFDDDGGLAKSTHFSNRLRSLANDIKVPINITHNLFVTLSINTWPCSTNSCLFGERLLASMNNVTMLLPKTQNILEAYYKGIRGVFTPNFPAKPPSIFDFTQGYKPENVVHPQFGTAVYMLDYNSEVEIVFQGTDYGFGDGIDHPMHLHGHNFYVVGSGYGNFDPNTDPPNFNLIDPPLADTVSVPRNGWSAIRFKANNPGVWYMHCHFERHHSWGMKMAFIVKDGEGPNEKMLPPPPDMPRCEPPPASTITII